MCALKPLHGYNRLIIADGDGKKDPKAGQILQINGPGYDGVVVSPMTKVELHSESYKNDKRNKVVKP